MIIIDSNRFIIMSMRLAGYLMMNGFVLLDIQPHKSIYNKKIFIFNKSKDLENKINEYKNLREVEKFSTSF